MCFGFLCNIGLKYFSFWGQMSQVLLKICRYSCPILIKLEFSLQIFVKSSNIKFHENLSSGTRVVPLWRTDRRTGMTNLTVDFRNFVNAPKNYFSCVLFLSCSASLELWSAVNLDFAADVFSGRNSTLTCFSVAYRDGIQNSNVNNVPQHRGQVVCPCVVKVGFRWRLQECSAWQVDDLRGVIFKGVQRQY